MQQQLLATWKQSTMLGRSSGALCSVDLTSHCKRPEQCGGSLGASALQIFSASAI